MNSNGSRCLVSLDGTDLPIKEPQPFDPKWFSHKINGAALRYEMGVAIQTGWIVWLHGPFPAGEWPDLRIMRDCIIYAVDEEEMLLADGGYADGGNYTVTPTGLNRPIDRSRALVRARHETCNHRLKVWQVLHQEFRHSPKNHYMCCRAVANITQHMIENGEPLFPVEYVD